MSQKLVELEKVITGNDLLQNLTGLFIEFNEAKDVKRSKKVKQLIKKLYDKEFSVGFCGHFSAGKSSMINELAGSEILPSSPIPTSANLVKVRSDVEVARVYLFNGDVVEFPAPYEIDEIKRFCMDGQDVEWIEIGTKSTMIPKGVTILDTPGIDSVDDAHRISTESALHLADIIFYMMDYNHVQSEVSFHFTKKLQEMNKPLYLIINQIDKHQEAEVPFHEFQKGVKQAFLDWEVKPEGIFYTSLKDQNIKLNQLSDLKSLLTHVYGSRDESLVKGIHDSAKTLISDHVQWLKEQNMDQVQKWEDHLEPLTIGQRQAVSSTIESINSKLTVEQSIVEKQRSLFIQDLTKLLDNAYLMPFETRELAQRFLEGEQPEFKVGFILTKQKTAAEREERLQTFYDDLMDKVRSQIDWHVKELLTAFSKQNNLPEALLNDVYEFKVTIEPSHIRALVKKGAKVTGDALLHFTNDVASQCKKEYRIVALNVVDNWLKFVQDRTLDAIHLLKIELRKYKQFAESIFNLEQFSSQLKSTNSQLSTILSDGPAQNVDVQKQTILNSFQIETKSPEDVFKVNSVVSSEVNIAREETDTELQAGKKINSADMVAKINSITEALHTIKGLKTVVEQLKEKGARLANQSFTVALFGAFSAGKSSFANALMGTKLLPVSPNPTTATINKIRPVTKDCPHGTVKVQVKDLKQFEGDLELSLKHFNLTFSTIEEALGHIQTVLTLDQIEPKQKPHFSFLKAVHTGYEQMRNHIGQVLFVDLAQFSAYVAEEEKSCFVEWIEVYYDCELTRQGITLVDTPGADSINARHTGVAFEYIKNADAILFVTYYNHAFSKADREFLIQLGRVKDVFELDKMFFLINAADLASSKEELELVQTYVSTQLLAYGIRKPRLFPISSLLALKEKEGENLEDTSVLEHSGIANFEASFKDFIQHELLDLTVTSAQLDLKKARQVLNEYIETAQIGNEEKHVRLEKLQREKKQIVTYIEASELEPSKKAIEKEIKELVYYVNQRVFLRFTEMYNESFHPSILSDENTNIKGALKECLTELTEFVAFDLHQELRATSVRIEGFLKKQLSALHQRTNSEARKIHEPLELTFIDQGAIDLIEFGSLTKGLDYSSISKPLSGFKNAKTFYELNGKKKMREELEALLHEPVTTYLEQNRVSLTTYYLETYLSLVEKWKSNSYVEIEHYFEGLFDILSEKMDLDELRKIETQVSEMM